MKSIRFIVGFATCMLLLIQATAQQVTIAEAEKVAASVMNYENVDTVLIDTVFAMVENGVGYAGGKCGPYVGQCLDSGAPNELTKKANLWIPHYGCGSGYRLYFTGVEYEVRKHGSEDLFLDDPNSPCGYKIYVNPLDPDNPYHNPTHCIPPEDMNYYISVFPEILEHYKPEGMVAIEAQYSHDILTSIPGSVEFLLSIKYGTCHCEPILYDE